MVGLQKLRVIVDIVGVVTVIVAVADIQEVFVRGVVTVVHTTEPKSAGIACILGLGFGCVGCSFKGVGCSGPGPSISSMQLFSQRLNTFLHPLPVHSAWSCIDLASQYY